MVHTLPAVALLKRHWPKSRLTWLVNPEWAPLLEGNPQVDEVAIFPRREFRGVAGWTRIPAWAKAMAAKKADLVLDFQGLLRSALIGRLCRGGELAGLSDAREGARFFYDRVAEVRGVRHAVDRYLRLVAEVGVPVSGDLEWPLPAGEKPDGFTLTKPFLMLHPFARGAGKSLTAAQVHELCVLLSPVEIVIAGRSDARLKPAANVTNLLNRTSLGELIWLIRRAAYVVSVDSGPMHIAAAITPNVLSIHTWSDPAKVGPYNPKACVWDGTALFRVGDIDGGRREPCTSLADIASFLSHQ